MPIGTFRRGTFFVGEEVIDMKRVSFSHFAALDIRIGKIVKVEDFPKARKPAYKLWIDFGPLGVKKTSAQITVLYEREELQNRKVVAVVNFFPKQIADFVSEVLVLGVEFDKTKVSLLNIDHEIPLGSKIS
jgi:tRNA-binding protein